MGQPISGTVDDALYQKVRYGSSFAMRCRWRMAPTPWCCTWRRLWFTGAGQRVFDVAAEGGVVVDNLDVWAAAGQFAALTRAFQTTVADGVLNLAFTAVADNANISAIEVLATGGAAISRRRSMPDRIRRLRLPSAVTLSGSATDDGLPTPPGRHLYVEQVQRPGHGDVRRRPRAATTTATFSTAGVYTLRLTANDSALSGFDDLVVTVNGSPGTAVYRINVAGGAFTDSQGRAWSADGNFAGTTGTFAVGQPISGTVDDALYQKVRYGSNFSYALPMANGTYTVVAARGGTLVHGSGAAGVRCRGRGQRGGRQSGRVGGGGAVCGVDAGVPDDGGGRGVEPGVHRSGGQRERLGDRGADHRRRRQSGAAGQCRAGSDDYPAQCGDAQRVGDRRWAAESAGGVTYTWSKFSGPGTVTFGTATAAMTTATFSTAGVYTLRLTANDGALSGFDDLVVTVNGGPGTAVYRINVAGGAFTDSQGRAWSADGNFTGTSGTFAVGQPISGTVDDALYQKERYGSSFAYALPLANGDLHGGACTSRRLWLHGAGQRVFDVAAEGSVVVDNLDVWAEAGQFAALTRAFQTTVADGVLNLAFTSVVDNANVVGDRGADDRRRRDGAADTDRAHRYGLEATRFRSAGTRRQARRATTSIVARPPPSVRRAHL